jgi:hypothetical protein
MPTNGTQLFGRTVQVVVGDLDISALDIEFHIKKTLKPVPNTCEIKVYNLSEQSIRKLETFSDGTPVKVLAGYGQDVSQLYLGETRAAWTDYKPQGETLTSLSTGTNAKAKKLKKIFQPVGANTPAKDVLQNLAAALGVPLGTISQKALGKLGSIATLHPKPGVLCGNAWQLITDFCASADIAWSIQDGTIQILDYGGALDNVAIALSANTGLIESPTTDIQGIVTAKTLLIPGIRPGIKLAFESRFVTGGYICQEAEYKGSNFGPDFHIQLKGRKY